LPDLILVLLPKKVFRRRETFDDDARRRRRKRRRRKKKSGLRIGLDIFRESRPVVDRTSSKKREIQHEKRQKRRSTFRGEQRRRSLLPLFLFADEQQALRRPHVV